MLEILHGRLRKHRLIAQQRQWKLLLTGILLIGMLIGLPLAGSQLAAQERAQRTQDRLAAEALWAQAGLERYTLTIDENGCRYVTHVRGGMAAIDGLQLNCTFQVSSVKAMFEMLTLDGTVERLCDTRGCPCESLTSVRGIYDSQRGYPTQIIVDVDLHPAWLTADLWKNLFADLALPPCLTHNVSTLRVVQLQSDQ